MAHQDYVTKKRTAKGKKSPYKPAPVEQSVSKKQQLIIVITIIIVLGFIALLVFLKLATKPATITPTISPQSVITPEKTLPKPPKEKWSYMKDLKTKQVEEGHYEVKVQGPFQLQCGSFRTEKQAQVLRAKIAFVGIEANIHKSQATSSVWYKVILGPYPRKRLAENDKHKLKLNNVNRCLIMLWQ